MTDPKPAQQQSAEQGKSWFRSLREKTWGQLLVFAGGIVLYILLGLLLWWGLNLYINPQDSAQKKDLVQALALIMAGGGRSYRHLFYLARPAAHPAGPAREPRKHPETDQQCAGTT